VAPECTEATRDAAVLLQSLGHEVLEDDGPTALDDLDALVAFTVIQASAVAHDVAQLAEVAGRAILPGDVEALTWSLHERGRAISAAELLACRELASAWSRRVASWWDTDDGFDLLLTPTMAQLPPLLGHVDGNDPDPDRALARIVPFGVFTAPFNVTGQPAVSVPLRVAAGLPIGVQLVAATGREDLLLRLAAELEEARPWPGVAPVYRSSHSVTERDTSTTE
jgi:amidase